MSVRSRFTSKPPHVLLIQGNAIIDHCAARPSGDGTPKGAEAPPSDSKKSDFVHASGRFLRLSYEISAVVR